MYRPISIIFGVVVLLPFLVQADTTVLATLRQVSPVHVGDVVRIPMDLSVGGEVGINTFSGRIIVHGPATVESVETGGSIFTYWPELENTGPQAVAYVGGVPSMVAGGPLHVFTVVLRPTGAGEVSVMHVNAVAYLGDGHGTQVAVPDAHVTLSVITSTSTPVDAESIARAGDTRPPDPFEIVVSRDASVFGGRYFITFHTTDQGTGVQRYEVVEGDTAPVVANSPYVLTDQGEHPRIEVRAYDYAGNVRIERYGDLSEGSNNVRAATVALLVGIILFFLWRWTTGRMTQR